MTKTGRLKRWEKSQAKDYFAHASSEYPKALNDLIKIKSNYKF
jgi:hypothetical protein